MKVVANDRLWGAMWKNVRVREKPTALSVAIVSGDEN